MSRRRTPADADWTAVTMFMTFRWFGEEDAVTLEHIRQIPGVEGIVSALYTMPPGDAWPRDGLALLRDRIESAGLRFSVVESLPVPVWSGSAADRRTT